MSKDHNTKKSSGHDNSRRDFLKKSAYVAPVVLTLNATPNLVAAHGSVKHETITNGVN